MESQLLRRDLLEGITYVPSDSDRAFRDLLDEVASIRQSGVVGLAARLSHVMGDEPAVNDFVKDVREIAIQPEATRRQLMDHPAFLVWIRQAAQCAAGALSEESKRHLAERLAEFPQLCRRVFAEAASAQIPCIAGTVFVRRDDVDPLIAAVAPPTYSFREVTSRAPTGVHSVVSRTHRGA
jgi:hypothetical protein